MKKWMFVGFFMLTIMGFSQLTPETYENDPIGVKKYTLENGLTVFLSENHELPEVFGLVMTKAGGKNDPADATGLAHYLEHMLFKGTETMGTIDYESEKVHLDSINDLYEELGKTNSVEERAKIQKEINEVSVRAAKYAIPNEIDKILSGIGATGVNAFTSPEMTVYYNRFPAHQMDKWLEVYDHRFEKPVFRLFQAELETVYEEKNVSADSPGSEAFETFLKHFYKKHPYGQQPIIGHTEHLKNPPLKRMYEFFDTYYVANNMALVLCGDFKSEEIIEKIKEKYGDWRTGEVPTFPKYEEVPFEGREYVEIKSTPLNLGFLGYRTPKVGHEDALAVEVIENMLTNSASTGFIDQLNIDGKIMFASVSPMAQHDYSASIVIFAPKLVGQKFEEAEEIITNQFNRIGEGDFTDKFLAATKQNMINDIQSNWEGNQGRAMQIIDAFSSGQNWSVYAQKQELIENITKEDIIKVAKKYFGENYLILNSKMGSSSPEKLDKPGFQPVVNKNEVKSEFYQKLEKIKSANAVIRPIDFDNEFDEVVLQEGVKLKRSINPYNDLFEMTITFNQGIKNDPRIDYLAQYLNYVGADTLSANDFRAELFNLGSKISVAAYDFDFDISIEGELRNLKPTLKWLNRFLNSPQLDQSVIDKIYSDKKSINKFELDDPQFLAEVLNEYALYGENSSFLKDLSLKEVKKLQADSLLSVFDFVKSHEVDIQFIGRGDLNKITKTIQQMVDLGEGARLPSAKMIEQEIINNPMVYYLPKKKAVQTQIGFIKPMGEYQSDLTPIVGTFNQYFGRNMSSLVFQEIREFRSLAYTAYGYVRTPRVKEGNYCFQGYIGCQADKTGDAMSAMDSLIQFMPEKPERMELLRSALINKLMSSEPNFRSKIARVEYWKRMGYVADPRPEMLEAYKQISFIDVVAYYEKYLKTLPTTYTIVGDKKRFDYDGLSKYGKVKKLKLKDIYNL